MQRWRKIEWTTEKTVRTCSLADRETDKHAGRRPDSQRETRWWSQPVPANGRVTQTENKEGGGERETLAQSSTNSYTPLSLSWPPSHLPSPLPWLLFFNFQFRAFCLFSSRLFMTEASVVLIWTIYHSLTYFILSVQLSFFVFIQGLFCLFSPICLEWQPGRQR